MEDKNDTDKFDVAFQNKNLKFLPLDLTSVSFLIDLWSLLTTLTSSLRDGKLSREEVDELLLELYQLLDAKVRVKS